MKEKKTWANLKINGILIYFDIMALITAIHKQN